jgi:hypothetical protein
MPSIADVDNRPFHALSHIERLRLHFPSEIPHPRGSPPPYFSDHLGVPSRENCGGTSVRQLSDKQLGQAQGQSETLKSPYNFHYSEAQQNRKMEG